MRILLATDAWTPQVNGVVRTLAHTVAECRAMGHEVDVVSPDQFKTFPLPTYPEIKLAMGAYEPVQDRFKSFEPEAIHIATEGPIGLAARRICMDWKLPFTTSYHTKFPEYVSARLPLPLSAGYAYMRWFHHPSGRVMVATPSLRDELEQHGFRNLSPWSRGVDTQVFRPRRPDDVDVYEGLPRPIWLNVGRIAVEKNVAAFLALDLPGTKVVVGDGPQREELALAHPEVVFRRRRCVRLPLDHRHLRPSDPGGHGHGRAGGRFPRARPDRPDPRLRRGRPGDQPDRRPARGLPGLSGAGPRRGARIRRALLLARLRGGVRAEPATLSRTGKDPVLAAAAATGAAAAQAGAGLAPAGLEI